MEYLQIPIPPGATPRIVYGNNIVTVHFDTTPAKRPLEDDDAQETAGDGGVDAEPADADDAHTAKRRRKDDNKAALAERLVEASDSEEEGQAEEEEGQRKRKTLTPTTTTRATFASKARWPASPRTPSSSLLPIGSSQQLTSRPS